MILDDFSIQVNYFLRESDLGSPVAAACAPRFREMNALAEIEVLSIDMENASSAANAAASAKAQVRIRSRVSKDRGRLASEKFDEAEGCVKHTRESALWD